MLGNAALIALALVYRALPAEGAKSIFDDDYVPPPSQMAPPPTPTSPPAQPPAGSQEPIPEPTPPPAPRIKPTVVGAQKPVHYPIAIPPAAECTAAEKLIRTLFKEEFAKTAAPDQLALGLKLAGEAATDTNDAATEYVLLRDAADALQAGGDVVQTVTTIEKLGRMYAMDWQAREAEALTAIGQRAPSPTSADAGTQFALVLSQKALNADRYDVAAKASAAAAALARKTREPGLVAWAASRADHTQVVQSQSAQVAPTMAKLNAAHGDADAFTAVGRFYCLWCGEWQRGLPLLAKGSDKVLKELASKESAKMDGDPAAQLAIGDAWMSAAGKETGAAKDGMLIHAASYYRLALPGLDGTSRMTTAKRLRDMDMAHADHGLIAEVYRGRSFEQRVTTRIDATVDWNWTTIPPAPRLFNFYSIRWTGWLKPPTAGTYKILARADDCARVWIDGKLVMDRWPGGANTDSVTLTLGTDPVDLKVEYFQIAGAAYMGLGWKIPNSKRPCAIPASALFHGPVDMQEMLPPVPASDHDGVIALPATQATIHGTHLNFYDQRAPMLAYWDQQSDWASWDFVAPPGDYDVEVRAAVGRESAGGTYSVNVGGAELSGTTGDTGGWESFQPQTIGRVHIIGGNQTLSIKCVSIARGGLLNLDSIVLTPAKDQ